MWTGPASSDRTPSPASVVPPDVDLTLVPPALPRGGLTIGLTDGRATRRLVVRGPQPVLDVIARHGRRDGVGPGLQPGSGRVAYR